MLVVGRIECVASVEDREKQRTSLWEAAKSSLDTVATTRSRPRKELGKNVKRRQLQLPQEWRPASSSSSDCSSTRFTYLDSALATRQTPCLRPPLDLLLVPASRHYPSIWRYRVAHWYTRVGSRRWEWPSLAIVLPYRWWHCGGHLGLRALLPLLLLLWLWSAIDGMYWRQAESRW